MENQENPQFQHPAYIVKSELLEGKISLREFSDKIIELDQITLDRKNALENLNILSSPDLVEYVEKQDEDIKKSFFRLRGFTEFHVFQIKAEHNEPDALTFLKEALEDYNMGRNLDSENFIKYIEGTLMYMQGEEISDEILKELKEDNNLKILKRMNDGLIRRGYPSYNEDYYGS